MDASKVSVLVDLSSESENFFDFFLHSFVMSFLFVQIHHHLRENLSFLVIVLVVEL